MLVAYVVSKNGAAWKYHDFHTEIPGQEAKRLQEAMAQAESVASRNPTYSIQGFDENGQSAVVDRETRVTVSREEYSPERGWKFVKLEAVWVGGKRKQ